MNKWLMGGRCPSGDEMGEANGAQRVLAILRREAERTILKGLSMGGPFALSGRLARLGVRLTGTVIEPGATVLQAPTPKAFGGHRARLGIVLST